MELYGTEYREVVGTLEANDRRRKLPRKIRGKQMIELTQEGKIDVFVPELMQMVLEMIEVHDLEHFTFCFLDGTKKEILV